jgi:hypothetical protein
MKRNLLFGVLLVSLLCSCNCQNPKKIDLSGEWKFRMDEQDKGESEKWFAAALPENVRLPGSMVENGKGYNVSPNTKWTGGIQKPDWMKDPAYAPYVDSVDFRFPFWLQPLKKYEGAAWYQKKITIPKNWKERKIWLNLERCHWESTVWLDGAKTGMQNSLATPHHYDLTSWCTPGEHLLTIRIDNRTKEIDPGENSHSISDHTQTNWNGMVGDLSLGATPVVYFSDIRVSPDVRKKLFVIEVRIVNESVDNIHGRLRVQANSKNPDGSLKTVVRKTTIKTGENIIKIEYPLGENARAWDEFHPNLYDLKISLKSKGGTDTRRIITGLREISVDGSRLAVNGKPVFLRGTLECAIFPKTGFPPAQKEEWLRIMRIIKAHGLNHIRFHSWCPPEAAFAAADETGVFFQVECSSWANQSTRLGDGMPIDQYIWDESKRIVRQYGNHPSFIMLAYGNEPGGRNANSFLKKFVSWWKENDPRRVYTSGAGWPLLPENDYYSSPRPRIQGWGEELKSIINGQPPRTDFDWSDRLPGDGKPVVSHEIGQWCVYPNFKEIAKYDGNLRARNLEIFQKSLIANGMEHLADSFLLASGKLQALCYKADIEAALRTPGFAGFQLLDLHDFPGQGTALVGVLDPFWEEKGYISPDAFRRFCNSTVPLVRLSKRIFMEGDTLLAKLEVAHFGEAPLSAADVVWKIKDSSGKIITEISFGERDIPIGNCIELGKIAYIFPALNLPRKLVLEVSVSGYSNSWDLWVYPKTGIVNREGIRVVEKLDKSIMNFLETGGKVLLSLGQGKVAPEMGGKVGVGFSSIFWNTAWTNNQKPHTLGILCNPDHPALRYFPTEYHSNWQWWDAMSHADAILLKDFPPSYHPIVRIIDDWVTNRSLALLFEVKVGAGKILVSGTDLVNDLEHRHEAAQLLSSLIRYMQGDQFNPQVNIGSSTLKEIVKTQRF